MNRWICVIALMSACSWTFAGSVPDERVLTLHGKMQAVDVNHEALQLAGCPITVQAWFRTTKTEGVIFECGASNRDPGPQAGYALYMKGGRLRFGANNSVEMYEDALWDDIWTKTRYDDGNWHHGTGVFQADGKTRVALYVDGVEVTDAQRLGQAQPALSAFTKTDAIARIGSRTGPMIYPNPEEFVWSGSIDEVRVWRRALSVEDVKANWDKEVDAASAGLVGYWKFAEEPSKLGDAARDSADGNDGFVAESEHVFLIEAPFFPVDTKVFPVDDFDYSKYPANITGYVGQDLQRVALVRWEKAERRRVGERGNYKPGFTQLADGRLVIAVCRKSPGYDADESKRFWLVFVYESQDLGKSWRQINETPLFGKEPALVATGKGTLVLSAQRGDYRPLARKGGAYIFRSTDGGKTWQKTVDDDGKFAYPYPRNILMGRDGLLIYLRPCGAGITSCRSADDGETWTFLDGKVDWDPEGENYAGRFAEIGVARLGDGRLLASLRVEFPRTLGHSFEGTYVTTSGDDGRSWSRPQYVSSAGEVQAYPTALADGRILLTYTNYHHPFGVSAIVSADGGETWDGEHPVQLALSRSDETGWAVTLQLGDGSLMTAYAITLYAQKDSPTTACEVVHWRLP
ncbi:MAG: LamG-like jellyroll fold domain-containing protein [Planctomycetota bacterium]